MPGVTFETCTTKATRIDFIRSMVGTNAAWAKRAVVRIYERQTASEQATGTTNNLNGVGFTGADAYILTSFAEQINSGRFVGSKKQMDILFKKMPKYAKQLESIAAAQDT